MQLYGIIGFPLGHSFSKKYFTEKFKHEAINADYLNFEIEQIGAIRQILDEHPELQGFNVTIPHKQNIIPLLTDLSEEARQVGAVNCVKINRSNGTITLTGYNTDVYGFKKSLQDFIPSGISKALILGNGGAAKAVRHVLQSIGMEVVTISRNPQNKGEAGYNEVCSFLQDHKLIVNTTPLGTWPNIHSCPDIPYHLLNSSHYLFDLVYNPEVTEFMKQGIIYNAHVHNGMDMLIGQAEKAWKIWQTGESPGTISNQGI